MDHCFYVSAPAQVSGGSTLDIIVDIENDRVEFVSDDKKDVIRLDVMGAAMLEETLRDIVNTKRFQIALGKKIGEYGSRYNTMDSPVL